MKPNKTQLAQIRAHLNKKPITSWEAIVLYRITRLSQYILLLRKEGVNITSERIVKNGKWFVKYIQK